MHFKEYIEMKEINGVMCHWVSDTQLVAKDVISMAVDDYALKCAHILNEYASPIENNVRFSTGIYQLMEQRWGIDGWYDKGYKKIGIYGGPDDRDEYEFYPKLITWLTKLGNINKYDLNILTDGAIKVLGAGETPFIVVKEYYDEHNATWEYIYYITR